MIDMIVGFFGQFGGLILLIGFVILPINWWITTRYYDNKLGFKKIYNPLRSKWFPFMVTMQYASLIVFKRGAKKSLDRFIFKEINFRKKARIIDKILAFEFVILVYGGILICLVSVFLSYIFKYI